MAIVLALAAHAGVLVVLLAASGRGVTGEGARPPVSVMSVKLAPVPVAPVARRAEQPAPRPSHIRFGSPSETAEGFEDDDVSLVRVAAPYYYRASELSRRPVLLGDAISRLSIELPGFAPVPAVLRLLIGIDGSVDRVVVEDSHLPAAVEARIVEAFSKVRFLPGKIGDHAVRSQLRIEVRLESVPDAQELSPGLTEARPEQG